MLETQGRERPFGDPQPTCARPPCPPPQELLSLPFPPLPGSWLSQRVLLHLHLTEAPSATGGTSSAPPCKEGNRGSDECDEPSSVPEPRAHPLGPAAVPALVTSLGRRVGESEVGGVLWGQSLSVCCPHLWDRRQCPLLCKGSGPEESTYLWFAHQDERTEQMFQADSTSERGDLS